MHANFFGNVGIFLELISQQGLTVGGTISMYHCDDQASCPRQKWQKTVVTYKHGSDTTCDCRVTRQDNDNRKIGLSKSDKTRQWQQKSYCHAEACFR